MSGLDNEDRSKVKSAVEKEGMLYLLMESSHFHIQLALNCSLKQFVVWSFDFRWHLQWSNEVKLQHASDHQQTSGTEV